MTKLENDSHAAQVLKWTSRISLRIHKRDTIGQHRFRFMVIEHDDVHVALFKFSDLTGRSSAAIDGDEQLRPMLFETTLEAFVTQPVTFFHTQRQKEFRSRDCGISAQHFIEQRQRGHAVNIVISKQDDAFVPIQRGENPRDGCPHLRQQKWIAQRTKTRVQKVLNFVRVPKPFPKKQSRDAFGPTNFIPRNSAAIEIFAWR